MQKILFILFFIFFSLPVFCETVALGYFSNETDKEEFDYLGEILPNTFASTLFSNNVKVIKPRKLTKMIEEEENIELSTNYSEQDLITIAKESKSDFFIFGSFTPENNYRIKLTISVYYAKNHELFSFITMGKLETELFDFVDSIIVQLQNILKSNIYYKSDSIPPNSKFAVISNLLPHEQNTFYMALLKNNFRIGTTGSTDFFNLNYIDGVKMFYEIMTDDGSFGVPVKKEMESKSKFYYGSWDTQKTLSDKKSTVEIVNMYYNDFSSIQKDIFQKYRKATKNTDYFLILDFNDSRSNLNLRCIDIKNNKLIWFQRNLNLDGEGFFSKKNNIENFAHLLIKKFPDTSK